MNKLIAFLYLQLILGIFCLDCKGQSRLDIGIMISPSVEKQLWLGTMDWFTFHDRPSLNFGGLIRINVSREWHISSGLTIYDKGSFMRLNSITAPYTIPYTTTHNLHSWYLTMPFRIGYSIKLKDHSTIYPSIGIAYGRLVWKYNIKKFANETVYHNRFYDSTNDNYWGLNFGLGFRYQFINGSSMLLRPNYFRQLNRGWDLNIEKTNQGRYDSYVVDLVLFYSWDKIFKKNPKQKVIQPTVE